MATRKYNSPDELRAVVDEYFKRAVNANIFPDYAGMKIFIGLKDERTVKKYRDEDPEYDEIFEEAKLRRESFLVRRMTANNKLAQGCLNALKQEINGGYTDKPVESGERKLVIELKGIGQNAYK